MKIIENRIILIFMLYLSYYVLILITFPMSDLGVMCEIPFYIRIIPFNFCQK